ncbi:MAG: hypothetical protein ACYTFT_05470 [Planctomycetota bacterium]
MSKQSVGVAADWGDTYAEGEILEAKWLQEQGFNGKDALMEITTKKIADGTPVEIQVFRRPRTELGDDANQQGDGNDADDGKGDADDKGEGDIDGVDVVDDLGGHFFEAVFKNAKGEPVKDVPYLLTRPDGSKKEGVLGSDGRIFENDLLKGGVMKVEFKSVEASS